MDDLVRSGMQSGRLRAAANVNSLGHIALVCVGTPSNDNGSLGLDQMLRVLGEIGALLKGSPTYVVINIRSTVLPGTVEQTIIPTLERTSGKTCGLDFGVCMNPEFMRETTAVRDFGDPPFTVIGARDRRSADRVAELYHKLNAPARADEHPRSGNDQVCMQRISCCEGMFCK